LEDEPELQFKLALLNGFKNLSQLSLRYCLNAVDDTLMSFIVTEMRALEVLEVSHCFNLSDAGIAGHLVDGSNSIRNLKGQSSENL